MDFLPPSLTLGSTARAGYTLISLLGLSILSSIPQNLVAALQISNTFSIASCSPFSLPKQSQAWSLQWCKPCVKSCGYPAKLY